MVKKSKKSSRVFTKQQQLRAHKLHQRIVGVSVVIAALILALILVLTIPAKIHDDARLRRINDIYASVKVSDQYTLQYANVFGAKRLYGYDKGRSFSSEKNYVRGANVDVTAKDLDTSIKAAGFTFVDEPYAGSTEIQYHYKSAAGEYIRLTVTSKLRNDAFQNSYLMTGKFSDNDFKIDPNAGPSSVSLKVNLDDNNE